MSDSISSRLSRRAFLGTTGLLTGAALGIGAAPALGEQPVSASAGSMLLRVLGRTKLTVSALTLGTAPCGQSKHYTSRDVGRLVDAAIEEGINFIDTARIYGSAEEGVGLALGTRRKEVVLTTKIWADTVAEAEKVFATSLKLLKTDHVDILYYHSIGNRDVRNARDPGGVFHWILKQRTAGKARFVGVSGHCLVERFPPYLASGDVDVVLMPLGFVDRYIYNFQEKVLPVAREHNVGVVGMKIFGGIRGGFGSYGGPKAPSQLDEKYLELAIRYSLGLPGVATLNIGAHEPDQVRANARMVRSYRPLDAEEAAMLAKLGQELAPKWGPRFGPAAEARG